MLDEGKARQGGRDCNYQPNQPKLEVGETRALGYAIVSTDKYLPHRSSTSYEVYPARRSVGTSLGGTVVADGWEGIVRARYVGKARFLMEPEEGEIGLAVRGTEERGIGEKGQIRKDEGGRSVRWDSGKAGW